MASKRKSTVPCMIPSKSKHVREEIILGSLPELLPTIPEDSILSISGEDAGHFSHSSSKSECGSEMQKGGTYSCPPCCFESRDLNYFLDHMHKCHVDFQAQPTFYCLNCGVSVVRFEKLALHNANAHPRIMEGSVTASLSVNRRDGVTSVEQSLFTDGAEEHKEAGISLTKTPIAKMMKAKGEHKKIVVSHTVEVRKIPDPGKEVDPSMLTNVPELQNGAQAMPRTTVTHLITTTVSNQVFHQHTPSLYSPPSSDSNKDLPKVMIPLSSIPTYDAAMDTSSFLKTSFGKFPYPTKAELCYLTVVSEFPEEQIKLWFTAQRLKQGISWSPEEIEEARRKMFNTVFQGGAPQKQPAAPRHINHIVTHHTVTAQPGSKGPNLQMTKVPYGSLKNRSIGVVPTQASVSTNPHVTRVSYSTPILPQKFPPLGRTTQAPTKNAQPPAESDKSNGLSLDAGGEAGSRKGSERIDSATANVSNNDEHCAAETNGKPPHGPGDGSPGGPEGSDGTKSHVIVNNTSKFNNHGGGGGSQEMSSAPRVEDGGERTSSPPRADGPSLNHASTAQTDSTSTTVITKSSSYVLDEFPIKGMSILQQLIKDDEPLGGDRSCPELKIDPINFKRLKMNEAEAASDTDSQEHKSEAADAAQASFSPPWANKNPQQLHVLRQVFSGTRWPSSQQYEELSVQTGLPKAEVVRWFSDSRYSHKNGQLKWLETYRRPESEGGRSHRGAGADSPKDAPAGKRKVGEQEVNKHPEGEGGLSSVQRLVWQDSYSPLLGLTPSDGSSAQSKAEETPAPRVLQDGWSGGPGDRRRGAAANQSLIDQTDAGEPRDRLRMELLEV